MAAYLRLCRSIGSIPCISRRSSLILLVFCPILLLAGCSGKALRRMLAGVLLVRRPSGRVSSPLLCVALLAVGICRGSSVRTLAVGCHRLLSWGGRRRGVGIALCRLLWLNHTALLAVCTVPPIRVLVRLHWGKCCVLLK
jgi:hypothetical protein